MPSTTNAYRCSPARSASVTDQRRDPSSRESGVASASHSLKSPATATRRASGSSNIKRTSRNVSRSVDTTADHDRREALPHRARGGRDDRQGGDAADSRREREPDDGLTAHPLPGTAAAMHRVPFRCGRTHALHHATSRALVAAERHVGAQRARDPALEPFRHSAPPAVARANVRMRAELAS